MFSSVAALEEMLIFGRRRRIARTDEYETAVWELGDDRMFAAVNLCGEEVRGLKLDGVSGSFMEFRGERRFGGGAEIVLDLRPFEVVVATTRKMDGGYEPLAAVKARERSLEYERTHRDNQLFGRAPELQFSASKPLGVQAKIADGMLEQQAELLRGANPWYEISFPKEPIVFCEVRIHGENVEKAVVKVRRMGKWVALEPAASELSGGALGLKFAEPVRTYRIRLEFHKDKVNLHEIEIPRPTVASRAASPSREARPGGVRGNSLEGQSCCVLDASNAFSTNNWSGKVWYGKSTKARVLGDGGFSLGAAGGTHAVRLDPKWRWAEFDIYRDAIHPDERGYANWRVSILGLQTLAGSTRSCPPGLYTMPLRPIDGAKHSYVQVGCINTDIPFRFIRLCERPPRYLEVTNPHAATNGCITAGDTLHFELVLDVPCEDVVLTYYSFNGDGTGPVAFSLDGRGGADLECRDGKGLVWAADVKVGKSVNAGKSAIYAKAVALGGPEPLTIRTRLP